MAKAILDIGDDYKKGDHAPEGYLAWHEWARVQYLGGLRQLQAPCGHWLFPQERVSHRCTIERLSGGDQD